MKRSISNKQKLSGKQQQISQVQKTVENDTFFPKGVHIDDIDDAVRNTIKSEFEIVFQNEKVEVFPIFSIQRYAEFIRMWKNLDDQNTIKLPFIGIVREPVKKGTNLGGTFNVPSTPTFNLWRRPILKNGKLSMEYYQIPQPVNVDCSYTIHLFTEYVRLVNKMDELILHAFKESQYYIEVNGHQMPLKLEGMDDPSEISDLEKRRYYHKTYSIVLKGYLLREEDFKKLPSIDKISVIQKTSTVKESRECVVTQDDLDCDLCLNFKFNRKSENSNTYRVPMDLEFYYDNQKPSNDYAYFLNGESTSLPFIAKKGDNLTVAHNIDSKKAINIKVCGKKIE